MWAQALGVKFDFDLFRMTSNFKRSPWAILTTVGVAPLLQVGVALQATVSRRDVLWCAGDRRFGHDRVWLWGLIHGFEFQPLVVNPKIWWLQVFGVSLVFVGAIWRLWGSPFSAGENTGTHKSMTSFNERRWPKYMKKWLKIGEVGTKGNGEFRNKKHHWVSYFFWWDVVRRVHKKAPTTTTMMVKAPTEMMITMTRMWFSLLLPTPDLPREKKD